MAHLTITGGRIATASSRATRPCSIRLVAPGLLSSGPPISPSFPACIPLVLAEDVPIRDVLAFPPQPITSPLAIEAATPRSPASTSCQISLPRGRCNAALRSMHWREFRFLKGECNCTVPEVGHEIKLLNFSKVSEPLQLQISRFAFNKTFEQAFVSPSGIHAFNRPTVREAGPDGCAWVPDYGAVRDFGQSDPDSKFVGDGNGPLVQISGTGVIWRIYPQ